MAIFVLGAEVRFFLWLQRLTKLPYWWSVAVFLPIFLFLDAIMDLRHQLFFNLTNAVTLSLGSENIRVARYSQNANFRGLKIQDAFFLVNNHDETGVSFLTEKRFDITAPNVPSLMWYPFVFRPFWGIYYLLQQLSGYCVITNLWRPEGWTPGPMNINTGAAIELHKHDIYCESKSRAEDYPEIWEGFAYAPYVVTDKEGVQDCDWSSDNQLCTTMRTWNQSYRWAWPFTFWWSQAITWVFVIIPFTFCLYYVCETSSMRVRRESLWSKIKGLCSKRSKEYIRFLSKIKTQIYCFSINFSLEFAFYF